MPQKRNPVALEHARSITSKALGQAAAIVAAVHNTPFGDIVDTEDDLQPLVASMFRDAQRAVALLTLSIQGATLDVDRMRSRAEDGGTTTTELADRLVRDFGMPFSKAHAMAAEFFAGRLAAAALKYTDEEIARMTSAANFIDVRRTPGGPSPSETSAALEASRELLTRDRRWLDGARSRLDNATAARRARAQAL
jgi:argininosuccinate lyase